MLCAWPDAPTQASQPSAGAAQQQRGPVAVPPGQHAEPLQHQRAEQLPPLPTACRRPATINTCDEQRVARPVPAQLPPIANSASRRPYRVRCCATCAASVRSDWKIGVVVLVVGAQLEAVALRHLQRKLQHVDRIEPQTLVEQRGLRVDLVGVEVEIEHLHQRDRQLRLQRRAFGRATAGAEDPLVVGTMRTETATAADCRGRAAATSRAQTPIEPRRASQAFEQMGVQAAGRQVLGALAQASASPCPIRGAARWRSSAPAPPCRGALARSAADRAAAAIRAATCGSDARARR